MFCFSKQAVSILFTSNRVPNPLQVVSLLILIVHVRSSAQQTAKPQATRKVAMRRGQDRDQFFACLNFYSHITYAEKRMTACGVDKTN